MNWENFYQERYDATRKEKDLLHFQIGWIKGSLHNLETLIKSGDIKCDDYTMAKLNRIAYCIDEAVIASKRNQEEIDALIQANKEQAKA